MSDAECVAKYGQTFEEMKLHNKALRAFPSSPRQNELKKQLEALISTRLDKQ